MSAPRTGPWNDGSEPDSLSWADAATGLRCHIKRNKHALSLCGYVEIPKGHPLHGVAYNQRTPESLRGVIDAVMNSPVGKRGPIEVMLMALGGDFRAGDLFNVHGSVTYSGEGYWGEPGYWFGFDCSHCDDLAPGYGSSDGEYRDIAYVRAECASLARQIKGLAS